MMEWDELVEYCKGCKRCTLANTRTNVVIGRGNKEAKLMMIGEGPGEQEDLQGKAFVGKAGKLLDLLLKGLGFRENEYYIANIVKCRPPGNRQPNDQEAEACLPFLRNQVAIIKPKIIVCLGGTAVKYIVDKNAKITKIRGSWIERKGYYIMPTYHPAALLRDNSKKEPMWNDFKKIREKLVKML